jgi:class 3 adenylate cyclase/predicted ATPase
MDIADWLRSLGLEQYEPAFRDNAIDGAVLPRLTPDDLKDIGVSQVGHRRKLLDAIAALGDPAPAATPAAVDPISPAVTAAPSGGERRQLTVMFCDLVGSTALSEKLDPEELRSLLHAYRTLCGDVIARYDGFVARYVGDGILTYFGWPTAHEEDAERAVRAALEIVHTVKRASSTEDLSVRIGIATGPVVVGEQAGAGDQSKLAVGSTPNLAARLQGLAVADQIVIATSTRRLVGSAFELTDLGERDLKGIAEPVHAWRVEHALTTESRFDANRGGSALTPLVGREEELDLLLRRWSQARDGEGQVVLLSGEPGIGKSRILSALCERLEAQGVRVLRFQCSPYYVNSAFWPVIDNFERALEFTRDEPADAKLDKLEALVVTRYARPLADVRFVASILSVPCEARYGALPIAPQKYKDETLRTLVDLTEARARQQPSAMLFEDAHWADPATLEVLDLLIDRVKAVPLVVVLTYRPEFQSRWSDQGHVGALNLSKLTRTQSAAMVSALAGGKALPAALLEQVLTRTDGVPLFVEELTKSILESGELREAGDHYEYGGSAHLVTIPATLRDSLMARLDRFMPVKEIAQIGAAIGREFSYELIAAVAPMPQTQLDASLAQLSESGLAFRRGTPPDAVYTFKHALVQDAAYSTLLRDRRQQLHARIAATLEGRFPDVVAAQPALLAQHYEGAGLTEKAVGYWLAAGRQAWGRSMSAEAVALLRRGLALVPSLPETDERQGRELDLQIALGQALVANRGWGTQEMGAAYARARHLAATLNRSRELLFTLQGEFQYHVSRADLSRARQLSAEMRDQGESSGDIPTRVLAYDASAYTCYYLGEFTAARAYVEQGLALYDPAHRLFYAELLANDMLVQLLVHSTIPLNCLGFINQSLSRVDAALAEARRRSHPFTLAVALSFAWITGWFIRLEPRLMLQYADESLALAVEHGLGFFRACALMQRGWCMAALGKAHEGIPLLVTGLADQREIGFMATTPYSLTLLADACRIGGELKLALEHVGEARRAADETQELMVQAETIRLLGDLLRCTGDLAAAEGSYVEALALARRQSAKLWELRSATSLARLWRDQGRRTEARDLLAPIYGWFTEGFDTKDLQDAKALLEQLTP